MSFGMDSEGEVAVVLVEDELVVENRGAFKDAVLRQLEAGARKFLVDFGDARYIDSAGLGVLVTVARAVREEGGELRICGLGEDLRTLFELTRLDTLFDIAEDRGSALDDF